MADAFKREFRARGKLCPEPAASGRVLLHPGGPMLAFVPVAFDVYRPLKPRRHRSLIAGWAVKPSVQRLSGDECPCRVMVLSAVGVSRRMMVSEAPAS